MLCYVQSKFCTIPVTAFSQYFSNPPPHIFCSLLASRALHYDVDWMYDLQGLHLSLHLLRVVLNQDVL